MAQDNSMKTLTPLTTHWNNRSLSSVASDAATFHSAQAHASHMELSHLETQARPRSQLSSGQEPMSPLRLRTSPVAESAEMGRQDVGYQENRQLVEVRRSMSSSSSTRRLKSPSNRKSSSSSSTSRSARSPTSPRRSSSRRPSIHTRYTTPQHQSAHTPYQFFHFPTLMDSTAAPPTTVSDPPPPPPPPAATVQYWTSDSTRRLEYAAIDAASRGVRGFFMKLIPDCFLPVERRRPRFHSGDDNASDAGSVRRYRLALPEEKIAASSMRAEEDSSSSKGPAAGKRPGVLRRWTSLGPRRP